MKRGRTSTWNEPRGHATLNTQRHTTYSAPPPTSPYALPATCPLNELPLFSAHLFLVRRLVVFLSLVRRLVVSLFRLVRTLVVFTLLSLELSSSVQHACRWPYAARKLPSSYPSLCAEL